MPVKSIAVPISEVVDYNLKEYKLGLRKDFDLKALLDHYVKPDAQKSFEFTKLSELARHLSYHGGLLVKQNKISGAFDEFLGALCYFFESTQNMRMKSAFEPEQTA